VLVGTLTRSPFSNILKIYLLIMRTKFSSHICVLCVCCSYHFLSKFIIFQKRWALGQNSVTQRLPVLRGQHDVPNVELDASELPDEPDDFVRVAPADDHHPAG